MAALCGVRPRVARRAAVRQTGRTPRPAPRKHTLRTGRGLVHAEVSQTVASLRRQPRSCELTGTSPSQRLARPVTPCSRQPSGCALAGSRLPQRSAGAVAPRGRRTDVARCPSGHGRVERPAGTATAQRRGAQADSGQGVRGPSSRSGVRALVTSQESPRRRRQASAGATQRRSTGSTGGTGNAAAQAAQAAPATLATPAAPGAGSTGSTGGSNQLLGKSAGVSRMGVSMPGAPPTSHQRRRGGAGPEGRGGSQGPGLHAKGLPDQAQAQGPPPSAPAGDLAGVTVAREKVEPGPCPPFRRRPPASSSERRGRRPRLAV